MPQSSPPPRLFLIDGSGFIFRAYHVLKLNRADGVAVGAVYGFVNMILKLSDGLGAHVGQDAVAVVFDAARKNYRNELYADYKANRPETPEDLIPQFALVREATAALNLPALEMENYEADDLIAAYATQGRKAGMEVTIISSDKDLMQLIGEGVAMYDPMKNKPIGEAEVMEKFGVRPEKVLDVLSLIGDTSDNIPGVPGIGPKTAAELIGRFGDLDTLLARAEEIPQAKRRESLVTFAEQAKLSRELARLCVDCPVPQPVETLTLKEPDHERLVHFCRAQGFKSLVARLEQKWGQVAAPSAQEGASAAPRAVQHRELVKDEAALRGWIEAARQAGALAIHAEAPEGELLGIALCLATKGSAYLPFNHTEMVAASQGNLFGDAGGGEVHRTRRAGQMEARAALALLEPLLADPAVLKIGHDIKHSKRLLEGFAAQIAPVDDVMLMSYVLGAGRDNHGLAEVAERELETPLMAADAIIGTGRGKLEWAQVEPEKMLGFAAERAEAALCLHSILKRRLFEEKLLSVYERIERTLAPVLAAMERRGVLVDRAQLAAMSKDFGARIAALAQEIHVLAGSEFNIGSPKQLGEILFDKLQLAKGKKSGKTGAYTTGADVLEELAAAGHEIAGKILEWRQLSKLKSTYSDALEQQINPVTGRVHTCYAMAVASTGRLSSTEPNLQNIPIRTEEGRRIRRAFIAAPGCKLLSADYSQIELRLLAHMADIATLKSAFRHGQDIHAITASEIFGVAPDQVNAELRRRAKTINFGIIYGMSAHGLAVRLGIGRGEAAGYIERYFQQYPGIQDYMERTKQFAREYGYVTTLFGRRCYVPGIHDKNPGMRSFSERAAINAPLQGTAADIIKRAMIQIDEALTFSSLTDGPSIVTDTSGSVILNEVKDPSLTLRMTESIEKSGVKPPPIRMLLQVHDELVFEIEDAQVESAKALIKKTMEQAASLSVPLVAEVGVGDHWGEIH